LHDIIVRRYSAALEELGNHAMPFATALALLAAAWGASRRAGLLAPLGADRGWFAALAGGLTAGVVGAISEDSGPVLFVVAVFVLGCVLSYIWGRPDGSRRRTVGAGAVENDLML
jgi:xanthine/CO dehydrogenase XdhC/CoxF family maturation factor